MVPTYFFTSVVFKLFVFLCVFSKRKKRSLSSRLLLFEPCSDRTNYKVVFPFPRLFRETRESERKSGRQFIVFEPPCRSTRSRRRTRRLARCVFLVALFLNRNRFLAKSRACSPIVLVAFSRISRVSFLNRDDARGDVIAKGEAGCLAQWCANGLEASRIVARAV